MKIKLKKIAQIFALFFVTSIFTLLFPVKLGNQLTYFVRNIIDTIDSSADFTSDGFYVTDKEIGYFNIKNSTMVYKQHAKGDDFIAGNALGYALYSKYGDTVRLFTNKGVNISNIKTTGYPHISEKYPIIYSLKSNGFGFSSNLFTGDTLIKEYSSNSMITSISTDKLFNTAVSFSDGKGLLINKDGIVILNTENLLSTINVAKSVAIDDSGTYFSVITGIEPEIISVYNIVSKSIVARYETKSDIRYSPVMRIHNETVYFETNNGIIYFTIKDQVFKSFNYRGELIEFSLSNDGSALILSKDNSFNFLYVYNSRGIIVYRTEFSDVVSNINFIDNDSFYVKLNDTIIIYSIKVDS